LALSKPLREKLGEGVLKKTGGGGTDLKFTLEHVTKAQRGIRGIDVFFNPGARWGWVVIATPRPLYPRE